MTCLSAKFCKHAKDCDIHMCSNTIEKCRAFNRKPNNKEEWLKSLDTEQLAEWFTDSGFLTCPLRDCYDCKYYDKGNDNCDDDVDHKQMWVEWLKQPHSEVRK